MSTTTGWLLLVASGLLDVAWALATKKADGFRQPGWTALSIVLLVAFVGSLTKALEVLPVSTAYAVWTGIGAVGTVTAGIILFGESAGAMRLGCVALIALGIVGLKLTAEG